MSFEQLCRACDLFPFTTDIKNTLSAYLGVSVRQINRFINGGTLSPPYIRLLEIRAQGLADLPQWEGFTVKGDTLINPSGEYINVADLLTLNFSKQRIFALTEQNAALSQKLINSIRL